MLPRRHVQCAALITTTLICSQSQATTETPPNLDARIAGMAAGGVAIQHNGAAIYHNPAELGAIDSYAGTLSLSPLKPSFSAPFPGGSKDSKSRIAPLFLIGAGMRLNEQFVIGLGAYTTAGFGTEYENVFGANQKITAFFLEVSPAVAFSPSKQLSFGLGYRISYAKLTSALSVPLPDNSFGRVEQDQSGTSFTGIHAGILYRPTSNLDLGLSYKNKIEPTLSGDMTAPGPVGPVTGEAETKFATPHRFAVGAAYKALDSKLLIAADAKYLLYKEANENLETRFETSVATMTQVQKLDWKNVFGFGVGAEYCVTEQVPLRAGYAFTQSATPKERPFAFLTPPGALHSVHVGGGVRLEQWDIDAAVVYGWGSSTVSASDLASDAPGGPGKYALTTLGGALSVTYHR